MQLRLRPARAKLTREGWDEFGAIILVQSLGEAVELAKQYSTKDSGRFVNWLLARIAEDVRPDDVGTDDVDSQDVGPQE